jgi:hypothetical protein
LLLHPGDKELAFVEEKNSLKTTWSSNALFISDNVATQIDSLGHIFEGDPPTPTTATARRRFRVTSGS